VNEEMAALFALLGKRWTLSVLGALLRGDDRFDQLRAAAPRLNARMLSSRLSELVHAGLLVRELAAGPPPLVHYRLTATGAALGPALAGFEHCLDRAAAPTQEAA
jgi:DNA-binding HxlR family transcriptional regulator